MKIENLIAEVDLPPLSDIIVRLQEIKEDESATFKQFEEVISLDPALTAKILRIANSAFYGFPSKISSVEKAMSVIGVDATYNLAIATTAVDSLCSIKVPNFDSDDFWSRSVHIGMLARKIRKLKMLSMGAERLFVSGLLLNVGELLCCIKYSNQVETVKNSEEQFPWEAQKQVFGHTYSEISAKVMESWKLPKNLYEPLTNMFDSTNSDKVALKLAYLSSLDMIDSSFLSFGSESDYKKYDHDDILDCIENANLEAFAMLQIINPAASMIF